MRKVENIKKSGCLEVLFNHTEDRAKERIEKTVSIIIQHYDKKPPARHDRFVLCFQPLILSKFHTSAILWNMRTPTKLPRTSAKSHHQSAAAVKTPTTKHVRRAEQRIITFLTQDEVRQLFKVIRSGIHVKRDTE